jgi:predicted Zn-dependent peptidase
MITKYFAGIPSVPAPKQPDITEPKQEKERTATKVDPLAKRPALAVSYHMPDRNTPEYYAMGLIDQILLQGDNSLLHDELVKKRGYTDSVDGGINLLGNMFNYQGPMLWTAYLFYDNTVKASDIVSAVESQIAPLRDKPVDQAALDRALIKMRSTFYDSLGEFNGFGRADMLASFALFDDSPAQINDVEAQFHKVTPELIQKTAAEYLRPTNRTVLVVEPKAADAAGTKSSN